MGIGRTPSRKLVLVESTEARNPPVLGEPASRARWVRGAQQRAQGALAVHLFIHLATQLNGSRARQVKKQSRWIA